jgi:hypothetical protein
VGDSLVVQRVRLPKILPAPSTLSLHEPSQHMLHETRRLVVEVQLLSNTRALRDGRDSVWDTKFLTKNLDIRWGDDAESGVVA